MLILQHVCQILVILHNSFLNSGKSVGTSSTSVTVSSVVNTSNSNPNAVVNPLVVFGLISPDLADILVTPSGDATVTKKRTRHIVGARDLTAEDYVSMLREDKERRSRKEKQRKEQERKKKEQEEAKRKKIEGRGIEKGHETGRGRGTGRGHGTARGRGTGKGCGTGRGRGTEDEVMNK